jgi:endonuclease/exonuclease/phosphatase family metal-dependent hydrolase
MARLRILTFNIAHGRGLTPIQGFTLGRKLRLNLHRIAGMIERLQPDIVALQEIDQNSRWAGSFDQLEYLRLNTGYRYSVFGINNRREGLLNLSYGNAILSRHPILESENIVFGESLVGEKGFLYTEIDVEGRRLPVMNLHLDYRSRVHRFRQVERVMDYITSNLTTQALADAKARGVTFGALSEREMEVIGGSADKLSRAWDSEKMQFRGRPETIEQALRELYSTFEGKKITTQLGVSKENQINQVWNQL